MTACHQLPHGLAGGIIGGGRTRCSGCRRSTCALAHGRCRLAAIGNHAQVTTTFFAAVEPGSAAFPIVERLQVAVAAAGLLTAEPCAVQAELRVRVVDGSAEVLRFYWSVQYDDPQSPYGVTARTVSCDVADPRPRTFEFPSEPVLTWLGDADGPLRGHGEGATASVLRYIPRRRVTFRLTGAAGLPAVVIGKVKRTGGLRRAATAFRAVHDAAVGSGVRVPRVLRLDLPGHLLCLEQLPGESLEHAAASLGLATAMDQLGLLQPHAARVRRARPAAPGGPPPTGWPTPRRRLRSSRCWCPRRPGRRDWSWTRWSGTRRPTTRRRTARATWRPTKCSATPPAGPSWTSTTATWPTRLSEVAAL